jgi:cytochrome P450
MNNDETAVPTGMALTHLNPIFRERPDEYLDVLRSREPVHQDRTFDRLVLTRAADVDAVMNDRNLASDPRKSRPGSFSRVQLSVDETFRPLILHMDDPDHKHLRDLVVKSFNRSAVDAMRPRITEVACGLLDDIDDPSCFDVMDTYARPLPTIAIALMLGVDTARCHDFERWSDGKIQMFNPRRTPEQEAILTFCDAALTGYFTEVIQRRRKERQADLISRLMTPKRPASNSTKRKLLVFVMLCSLRATLRRPTLSVTPCWRCYSTLANSVNCSPNRTWSATPSRKRYAMTRQSCTALGSHPGRCRLAAARSPRGRRSMRCSMQRIATQRRIPIQSALTSNDEISVTTHLAGGAHFCLGAPLARAEAQIALSMLFKRFPNLRLRTDRALERRMTLNFNGLEALWVRADQ